MPGIVQDQYDAAVHIPVSVLQGQAPQKCLSVADVRLGVDPRAPSATDDDRVPRAQVRPRVDVARHDGHLDQPPKLRSEPSPETLEQRLLRPIAKRLPSRVRSRRELQTDDRSEPSKTIERDHRRPTLTDPRHLLTGEAERAPKHGIAQAAIDPSVFDLATDRSDKVTTAVLPDLDGA